MYWFPITTMKYMRQLTTRKNKLFFADNSKAFQTEWLYYLGLTVKEGIHGGKANEVTHELHEPATKKGERHKGTTISTRG